jgi:hypothetical protein
VARALDRVTSSAKGRSMRARSGDPDPVLGIPKSTPSEPSHSAPPARPTLTNDGRPGRTPRRRSRPWSVLDLIWSFGDYSHLSWSAKFRLEPSIVVAAHDGDLLGQFVLDLTKAILDGQGWEFLLRRTRFDGSCYVVTDTRPRSSELGPEDQSARQQPPFPSGGDHGQAPHVAA